MNIERIFENATRTKLRFAFKGNATVEDLWDLSVEELDSIFKQLNTQVKQSAEESLLDKKTSADEILDVKIGIIKHIVTVKQNEEKARVDAKVKKDKREKILALIAQKDEDELHGKSKEQLLKELEEIDQ